MNLQTVRQNMLNSYNSIGYFNQSLKHLINSTNSINVNNALNISQLCIEMVNIMSMVTNDVDVMYQLNVKELHIFFKEFNEDTKRIFRVFDTIFKAISEINKVAVREHFLYLVTNNVIGDRTTVKEPSINVDNKSLISPLNELETFRIKINLHNNKISKGGNK